MKDSTVLLSASHTPTIHHLFSELYDLFIHIDSYIGEGQAMPEGFEQDDMVMGESITEACSETSISEYRCSLNTDTVQAMMLYGD